MNISRGMKRLWLGLSLLWVVPVVFFGWDDLHDLGDVFKYVLVPPIVLAGIFWLISYVMEGFKGH